MPNLAATLRSEIRKVTAREVKKALRSLTKVQRQLKTLKLATRGHRRTLSSLQRRIERLKARAAAGLRSAAGGRAARYGAEAIRALRARFKMTRLQFSKLLNVSPGSIFGWETGRTVPRGRSMARLAEARKLGARAAHATAGGSQRKRTRRRRTRRARRSRR